MSRRKAPIEEIMEVLSGIPWWANLIFGAVAYVGLKWILPAMLMGMDNPRVLFSLPKILAGVVPVIAPFVALFFVLTAIVSVIRQILRGNFFKNNSNPAAVQAMDWRNFEILTSEYFKRQGYRVEETGGGGPDGGVDLILYNQGEKILVQCKHWKAFKIGASIVRELYGVMVDSGASKGIIVTSGDFTPDALDFVQDKPIRMINGNELAKMLAIVVPDKKLPQAVMQTEPAPAQISAPGLSPVKQSEHSDKDWHATNSVTPTCPHCKLAMVLRTAKHGRHIGSKFWGCINYPHCKQTQPYPYWG